ncbi:hypothetical protein A2U01_0106383, partial [Trifolium medium]|nr:hypothetical protein [Trifolium medium]
VKRRKDSSDTEGDQPASEGKNVIDTEGAPEDKGKKPIVSDSTAAIAPQKKRSDKDKSDMVVKEKEKRKRNTAS